jgi:hypothetical protein
VEWKLRDVHHHQYHQTRPPLPGAAHMPWIYQADASFFGRSRRQEMDVSDRTRPCRRATAGDRTTGDAVRGFVSVAAAVPARSLTSSGPGIIQRTVQAKPLPTGGRGRGIS